MRVLLDTHALLWAALEPERLGARARALLISEGGHFVSIVSCWELAIKCGAGKLRLPMGAVEFAQQSVSHLGLTWLPVTLDHIRRLQQLPPYHRDPFDRMLIAQALAEQMPMITADREFARYGLEVIW